MVAASGMCVTVYQLYLAHQCLYSPIPTLGRYWVWSPHPLWHPNVVRAPIQAVEVYHWLAPRALEILKAITCL